MDLRAHGVTMATMTSRLAIAALLALAGLAAAADVAPQVLDSSAPLPQATPAGEPPAAGSPVEITEIIVQAPEARYVAPTRRDQIGRIWAPVYINDQGPFRLVLDTGASRS